MVTYQVSMSSIDLGVGVVLGAYNNATWHLAAKIPTPICSLCTLCYLSKLLVTRFLFMVKDDPI